MSRDLERRSGSRPQESDKMTSDQVTQAMLDRSRQKEKTEAAKAERKISPHERGRKARVLSLTLPTAEWKAAIAQQAAAWNLRPSDFVIFAISLTMQAIGDGTTDRPEGEIDQFRHKAGEGLELPWRP